MTLPTIGVIGTGVLGSFHLEKLLKNKQCNCIGFFDANSDRRITISQKYNVQGFADLDSFLAACTACIVATPCTSHYEIVSQCLLAGKHVLVEKPLASTYTEGSKLVALAEQNHCILQVGHSENYNAAFMRLSALMPSPRFIEIHRLAAFSERGTDVSVVVDLMVHDLFLILQLCNEEPQYETIMATGVPVLSDSIDIANVRLQFPSGCVANVTASRISVQRMRKVRVFQKDNYFSVNLDTGELDHYRVLPAAQRLQSPAPFSHSHEKIPMHDALETEQAAFLATMFDPKNKNGISGASALRVLAITDAILAKI